MGSARLSPQRLALADQTAAFWDRRHRLLSNLRSGGHASRTEAENQAFYDVRLGMLQELLGAYGGTAGRNTVLDAGSGKGWFSEALSRAGYVVTGIDVSREAIDKASATAPLARFYLGDISESAHLGPFDHVVCIDVLFHILDDEHWRSALLHLSSVVNPGGTLIYSDTLGERLEDRGGYIRVRPQEMYDAVLREAGLRATGQRRYGSIRDGLGFFRYERR